MEQIKRYIEILKEEINKSKMDGVEKINVFGTIGMIERELFYSKKQDEYAKVKITFPNKETQRSAPNAAFFCGVNITVDGKPLMCKAYHLAGEYRGELVLFLPPDAFEIAVEEETAEDLIKEIKSEPNRN